MSTYFIDLWKIPAFRRSFSLLSSVDQRQVPLLERVLNGSDLELEDVAADVAPEDVDKLREILTVFRSLRGIRDNEGLPALVDDIDLSVGASESRASDLVKQLMSESPEEVVRRRINVAQRSGLPVLTRISMDIDLRVSPPDDRSQQENFGLVPVMVVRLEFDENVAGSDAIVFQVTDEELDSFAAVINNSTRLRKQVVLNLPSTLLLGPEIKD